MEIIFEHNKLSILEADREELKNFFQFMFGGEAKADYSAAIEAVIKPEAPAIETAEPVKTETESKAVEELNEAVAEQPAKPIAPFRHIILPAKVRDAEEEEDYLTLHEAAERYGIRYSTLLTRLKGKGIEKIKDIETGRMVYRLSDLRPFINPARSYCLREKPTVKEKVKDKRYGENSWRNVSTYLEWAEEVRSRIVSKGLNDDAVLSVVYRKMTTHYGIVWQQVRSDYRRELRETTRDKLRLAYFLEYEQEDNRLGCVVRLLENLVEDVCSESLRKVL